MRTRVGVVAALIPLLLLSGCAGSPPSSAPAATSSSSAVESETQTSPSAATGTPTESPVPQPSEGGPAQISDTGVGDLVVGKPVAGGAFVAWNPDACSDGRGAYVTDGDDPFGRESFATTTTDFKKSSPIDNIIVFTSTITTAQGIHPGSTRAELEAAYPGFAKVYENDLTDLYVLENDTAQTVFEVANAAVAGADAPEVEPDTVLWITVERASNKAAAIYATDAAGPCRA